MLRLRYRKHHRQLISTLCMVFDELLVLEGRGHVSHILWFVSGRMKSWDKQIYRQRVLLLIRQCSHHFHSSHSYLWVFFIAFFYCIAWNCLFWEGKLNLADTFTLLLSTKITVFPSYWPLVWKSNNYIISFGFFSHNINIGQ